MVDTLRALLKKYRELVLYLVFGGLTTAVNITVYMALRSVFPDAVSWKQLGNAIAWLISVLFAYITNRTYVFKSRADTSRGVLKEMISFFAARVFSGAVDMLIMQVGLAVLSIHDLTVKIFANVLVIIINYILSKFIIFKKKP